MSSTFLGQLRKNIGQAVQWLPKAALKPMQIQPSETTGQVLTTTANGTEWAASTGGGGGGADASTTTKGISKLSVAPVTASDPIAVGTNDSRMTDARTPLAHAASHRSGGTDALKIHELAVPTAATPMGGFGFTGLGSLQWGGDTTLSRAAAGRLNVSSLLTVLGSASTAMAYGSYLSGEVDYQFGITTAGTMSWGGGAGSRDVSLSRTNPNELTLATGDVFKHDTPAATVNDTTSATTAFVKSQKLHDFALATASVAMNNQVFTGLGAGSAAGHSLRYEQLFTLANLALEGSVSSPAAITAYSGGAATSQLSNGFLGAYLSGDSFHRVVLSVTTGLALGSGAAAQDWSLTRTGPNEATIAAGDVLKHDTPAENDNSTKSATTQYVDRATGNASSSRPACHVFTALAGGASTVPGTGAEALLTFSSEAFDTDGMHSTTTNTDRITANTPGVYDVKVGTRLAPTSANTQHYIVLRQYNSAGTLKAEWYETKKESAVGWTFDTEVNLSRSMYFDAGDYIRAWAGQGSGSAITLRADTTYMSAVWNGGTGAAWGNAGARVYKSGAQTLTAASTDYPITFDQESFDLDGMHSQSSNTERLTCVTAGLYGVQANMLLGTSTTGYYYSAKVERYNAAGVAQETVAYAEDRPAARAAATYIPVQLTGTCQMNVGDYLVLIMRSDLAGNVVYGGGIAGASSFSAVRVGYQTNPSDPPAGKLRQSATTSIGSGALAPLTFSMIDETQGGMVSASAMDRITIQRAGLYLVGGSCSYAASGSAGRYATHVSRNGSTSDWVCYQSDNNVGAGQLDHNFSQIRRLSVGDTLTLYPYQLTGGTITMYNTSTSPTLWAHFIRP